MKKWQIAFILMSAFLFATIFASIAVNLSKHATKPVIQIKTK